MTLRWDPHGKPPLGAHRSSASEDVTCLICHVNSLDHVMNGLCDFFGKSFSRYVTTVASLVTIGIVIMEI